jgi:signal peptidase II
VNPRKIGILAALVAALVDQASKLWLLHVFHLAERQPFRVAPVLDLVLVWNRGISYSLLWAEGNAGRWLLVGATLLATALLGLWLWRVRSAMTGLALGLLIGGALGNVVDRVAYGAVADFVYFHVGSFRWYIFNGADCAIVIGIALLLIELIWPPAAPEAYKTP